jgi:ribose 5-phosphate isomerase A
MTEGATATGGDDPGVRAAAELAADLVPNGARVGLGSGRAASAFIAALGLRVRQGLSIAGVPTSEPSAELARAVGIPLLDLDEALELELTVDGADEVTPQLDLLKGRGAAFVRERIVAAASRRQVIVVGRDKQVSALCARFGFPVEVVPMARGLALRRFKALGLVPSVRLGPAGVEPLLSANGNLIVDCAPPEPLADGGAARRIEAAVLEIPGVLDTGLFLGTAERVLVGHPDGRVTTLLPPGSP